MEGFFPPIFMFLGIACTHAYINYFNGKIIILKGWISTTRKKKLNNDQIWQYVKWAPVKTCGQLENFVFKLGKWRIFYLIVIDRKCGTKHINSVFLAVRRHKTSTEFCKTQTETHI